MDVTPSTIYWISVLDSMRDAMIVLAILSALITGFLALHAFLDDDLLPFKKAGVAAACVFVASLVIGSFTPSAKTCAAMYVVPAIANSEKLQGVTDGIYELALEWLKDLKSSKANGKKDEAKAGK